jgi:MFS family permease
MALTAPGNTPSNAEERAEDAAIDADVPFTPGSARAAFAYRDFRLVWLGSLGSNIGTWMQNIALGVFGYHLTHSAQFVALLGFAQLGPLLLLSPFGGMLADAVDRRLLLIWMQVEQLVFSFALAWIVWVPHPSKLLVVGCTAVIGVGNALNAPAMAAVLPALVRKEDIGGAVSLQSVQMNVSRVVGPAIGGLLLPLVHPAGIFALNGVTFLFVIAALVAVHPPAVEGSEGPVLRGWRKLVGGLAVARGDRLVRNCLITIASISFFCLPFIGLMPVVADKNLGIDPQSAAYGWLYACFGLGAAVGAVSVGTVLVHRSKPRMVRVGLACFALTLLVFALLRSAALGFPVAFLVGLSYFTTVTSLSTHLQEHLSDAVRGRVMALWIMGFGGTVPLGLMAGGAIASRTDITDVVLGGAFIAAVLAVLTNIRAPRVSPGPDQEAAGSLQVLRP